MAELTYDNLNMELVVWYNGTVSAFETEVYTKDSNGNPTSLNQNSDKLKEYADKVILITGSTETNPDTAGKAQAIFISKTNANGTIEGKLMKLSDIPGYIAGINVGGTNHVANGDVILKLVGKDISITVNPEGTVNFDASLLTAGIGNAASAAATADGKAQNALDRIDALVGDSGSGTIAGIVSDAIAGVVGEDGDESTDSTIYGAKAYADSKVGSLKTEIFGDGNKILEKNLPDYILGQLKFGGTISNTAATLGSPTSFQITISASYDYKTSKGTGDKINITKPSDFLASNNEGWYFIVAKTDDSVGDFAWGTADNIFRVGDWFLSTGVEWVRIDNTDAVTSVADFTGAVSIDQIKGKLSGLGTSHFATSVNTSLGKADTAVQSVVAKTESVTVGSSTKTKQYLTAGGKDSAGKVVIDANIKTMSDVKTNSNLDLYYTGLADARDVYNFIKARLSIRKV